MPASPSPSPSPSLAAPEAPPAPGASAAIRAVGARATPARVRVLELLQAAGGALSHQEVEQALGAAAGDRVTLYRVLDWLVAAGLARRAIDERRVFRYAAGGVAEHAAHCHFRCDDCGRVFCLASPSPLPPALPEGFRPQGMAVEVHGQCPGCAGYVRP